MANVLNSIIANQSIKPAKQEDFTAFTFSSEGRVKPMKDRGRLLPSKIFGSPIEYAKDLKKDVISIGKAAKGKANDHELGRINDLAMKIGSVALATYLFVKNPFKLSKTMEFVGAGTFFAGMSLWPKLAIQAPLKARTGVDIHQKYVDSQGRKKMLYQDPQYVLTDLYSKEELNKIGDKLGVSKDLPDRDNFIKQRAQKTALQGNTLWMMTAGLATPLISALACNRLEQPINNVMEQASLISTDKALKANKLGFFGRLKQKFEDIAFERFLKKHSDDVLDDKMIGTLTEKIASRGNSAKFTSAVQKHLKGLKPTSTWSMASLKEALKASNIDEKLIASLDNLTEAQAKALSSALQKGSVPSIASSLTNIAGGTSIAKQKLSVTLTNALNRAQSANAAAAQTTVGAVVDNIRGLRTGVQGFVNSKQIIDNYVLARVGERPNTYIANQWDRVCNSFIKALGLNSSELQAVAGGDMTKLVSKIDDLVADESKFDKTISTLMKLIGDYEEKTGKGTFVQRVSEASKKMGDDAAKAMKGQFDDIAAAISSASKAPFGSVAQTTAKLAENAPIGSRGSYYRLVQVLDLFKKSKDPKFIDRAKQLIKQNSPDMADDLLDDAAKKLIDTAKKLLLTAKPSDYSEKLTTVNFGLSPAQYKSVMSLLFDSKADSTIGRSLAKSMSSERAGKLMGGLRAYQDEFMGKVANWQNGMTSGLSKYVVDASKKVPSDFGEMASLIGNDPSNAIKQSATKMFNSNKWLKIFGGAFIALTAVTLIAGLAIGRKGETEKQVEEESKKVNG